jgi:hypothetical protein
MKLACECGALCRHSNHNRARRLDKVPLQLLWRELKDVGERSDACFDQLILLKVGQRFGLGPSEPAREYGLLLRKLRPDRYLLVRKQKREISKLRSLVCPPARFEAQQGRPEGRRP